MKPGALPAGLAVTVAALGAAPALSADAAVFHAAQPGFMDLVRGVVYGVILVLAIYLVRHLLFTLNRLFGRQRHPYLDIDEADWPFVTVLVPAHNERTVIGTALEALVDVDYPRERLRIVVVEDRSTDGTAEIVDDYLRAHPDIMRALHRRTGTPGKAAALKAAMHLVQGEVVIVFDADYIPGRGLIKQLAAPFFDPEQGAVMGRVVPQNTGTNLLTRLLDMERAAGYQVDQQARMNLELVPQYGGTVGGVRLSALKEIGGWREDTLAEDTDLTYRLLLHGYKIAYENRCECYEEVPENWQERNRQIMRWAKGHNQSAFRYAWGLLRSPRVGLVERLDGLLLLGVYTVAPLLLVGWLGAVVLYYLGEQLFAGTMAGVMLFITFSSLGNFATFFEIAAAVYLDGTGPRVRLLPLNLVGFLVSLVNITRALLQLVFVDPWRRRAGVRWEKTRRYRLS